MHSRCLPLRGWEGTGTTWCKVQSGIRSKKKARTRSQMKHIKLRFVKNLFLRLNSKFLCYSLQNFTWLKPAKTALFDWTAL